MTGKSSFLLVLLVSFGNALANDGQLKQTPERLQQQYQTLLSGVEVIEGYRMVKVFEVDRFWRTVSDSLKSGREALNQLKDEKASLQKKVAALTKTINQKNSDNADLIFAGKHITVFGRAWRKSAFITMAFITTVVLLTVIVLLVVVGKVNYRASLDARKLYEELYREFEQYRHNAVERQIKLSRELQDYRNRQMDLRSA